MTSSLFLETCSVRVSFVSTMWDPMRARSGGISMGIVSLCSSTGHPNVWFCIWTKYLFEFLSDRDIKYGLSLRTYIYIYNHIYIIFTIFIYYVYLLYVFTIYMFTIYICYIYLLYIIFTIYIFTINIFTIYIYLLYLYLLYLYLLSIFTINIFTICIYIIYIYMQICFHIDAHI